MFKILLVEDDKELNASVCAYLNQNGYEAIGCLNANDAYNEMAHAVNPYGDGKASERSVDAIIHYFMGTVERPEDLK